MQCKIMTMNHLKRYCLTQVSASRRKESHLTPVNTKNGLRHTNSLRAIKVVLQVQEKFS